MMARRIAGIFVVFTLAAVLLARGQGLEIPSLINYQGKLVNGTNLVNGAMTMSFRLYNEQTGSGLPQCEDSGTVSVVDGLYSAYIGDDVVWGSLDVALNQTQVWVEVVVDGTNILSPRERLVSVGYARFAAGLPANAVQSHMIAPSQIYGSHIADGQIGSADIANFGISNINLAFGSVSASVIADNNITGAKILNGTITAVDIATNTFWSTTGNAQTVPGMHFLGTTDTQPLDLYANSQRVFRLDGTISAPNIIGGSVSNEVNSAAAGGTISGGGGLWGENPNRITDNYGTIGGGAGNQAGNNAGNVFDAEYATVAGGGFNHAENSYATIAGGRSNSVLSVGAFVGGGQGNRIADQATNAVIAGGRMNDIGATAFDAFVGGGYSNMVESGAVGTVIAGGQANMVGQGAYLSSIGGGMRNHVGTNAIRATISGGAYNRIEEEAQSAFIGGGQYNRMEQRSRYSAIAGGFNNEIGAGCSNVVIGGGGNNTVQSNSVGAVIGGGVSNAVGSHVYCGVIGGGDDNYVKDNTEYATIPGGKKAKADNYGQIAYASGNFAAAGDAQAGLYVLRRETTTTNWSTLYLDGVGAEITADTYEDIAFDALIVCKTAGTGVSRGAAYRVEGVLQWDGTLLRQVLFTVYVLYEISPWWDVDVNVDSMMGNILRFSVKGDANMRWVANVRTAEVTW